MLLLTFQRPIHDAAEWSEQMLVLLDHCRDLVLIVGSPVLHRRRLVRRNDPLPLREDKLPNRSVQFLSCLCIRMWFPFGTSLNAEGQLL